MRSYLRRLDVHTSGGAIIALLLIGVALPALSQAWGSGSLALSPQASYTTSDWLSWASTAWKYYTPGVGVNSATGLHRANLAWSCFADWDLGTYIYAIISARKLGLISVSGAWQFDDRIGKVLSFLKSRPLGTNNIPYEAYDWSGAVCSGYLSPPLYTNPGDSGRLLAALNALRNFNSTDSSDVSAIFTRSKSAYDSLVLQVGKYDYYGYLAAEGFAAFGYDVSASFANIDSFSGSYVSTYGQCLPVVGTVAEPIDHVLLEGDTLVHPPSSNFLNFAGRVELAQAGRYSALGKLTAWSEGVYFTQSTGYYIYEVVLENATLTWFLTGGATVPLAYTKVAFTYLAVYGESAYTLALVNAAKNLASSSYGFGEATYENGQSAIGVWPSSPAFYSDKTNEFILAAANYAINHTTTSSSSSSSSTSNSVSNMGTSVINAAAHTVAFVLPDYTGPYHTSPSKPNGVLAAQLSDYSAGGYVLGLLSNQQNEYLDTSACGSPTGITGTTVTLAGPGVNGLVKYYEQVAGGSGITPVYYYWDGTRNNFVVRASGVKYTVPNAGGNTAAGDDLFLIEAFTDSQGRSVFTLYGFSWQGTLAAGVFFASYVYAQLQQFPDSWYIYRWQDASAGTSFNKFPDPGDVYTFIASASGSAPSLSPSSSPPSGTAYSGFANIGKDVFGASQGSVYFILPDYTGPYHTSSAKCSARGAAALSDYSAGGYVLSADSNTQNQVLDTGGSLNSTSASCGQFLGGASTLVTVAGPGVNTAIYYYEQVAKVTPVSYLWDGSRNNFVVRATGAKYTVSPQGAGNTKAGDDLFLLETFTDSQGRHVYVVYGFSWQGTLAGATYLNTYVRSHLSSFQNGWYIYEWKDQLPTPPETLGPGIIPPSGNSFPDPPTVPVYNSDSYTQLATGN